MWLIISSLSGELLTLNILNAKSFHKQNKHLSNDKKLSQADVICVRVTQNTPGKMLKLQGNIQVDLSFYVIVLKIDLKILMLLIRKTANVVSFERTPERLYLSLKNLAFIYL